MTEETTRAVLSLLKREGRMATGNVEESADEMGSTLEKENREVMETVGHIGMILEEAPPFSTFNPALFMIGVVLVYYCVSHQLQADSLKRELGT